MLSSRKWKQLNSAEWEPVGVDLKKGSNDKDRILKAAREKQVVSYKETPIRLSADFWKETLQARRDWQEILKVMKSKGPQPRLLYPAKLSFRIKRQTKSSTDKKT